jgi:hypothetical protein
MYGKEKGIEREEIKNSYEVNKKLNNIEVVPKLN